MLHGMCCIMEFIIVWIFVYTHRFLSTIRICINIYEYSTAMFTCWIWNPATSMRYMANSMCWMEEKVSVGETIGLSVSLCHSSSTTVVTWKLSVSPSLCGSQRWELFRGMASGTKPLWTLNSTTSAASREHLFALQKLSTNGNQVGFSPYVALIKTCSVAQLKIDMKG